MATNLLANILITAVISHGFLAAASPVVPAKPQHPTAERQMSLEIPVADQQERILKFLSLFDEAQKVPFPWQTLKSVASKFTPRHMKKKSKRQEGVNEGPFTIKEQGPLRNKSFAREELLEAFTANLLEN